MSERREWKHVTSIKHSMHYGTEEQSFGLPIHVREVLPGDDPPDGEWYVTGSEYEAVANERDQLLAAAKAVIEDAEKGRPRNFDKLREAIEECEVSDGVCDHQWTDARNSVVKSGEICLKCGAIRPSSPR